MNATPDSSTSADGAVRLRSIYVSSPDDGEVEKAVAVGGGRGDAPQSSDDVRGDPERFSDTKDAPAEEEHYVKNPVQLPQSTHSLLFTQPVCSLPFAFAIGILLMSFGCLGLAFINNYDVNKIPVNVTPAVRGAQYLSILVVLLMEEEIPTGLYLLRRISRQSLQQQFSEMKYRKFFFSSVVRILNGYYFILNVLLVLVQANGVLEIFYDVLALQFVQQLDDIAFTLAKMDVFGKTLERACTAKCFRAEFEKHKGRGRKVNPFSIFLKAVYFFNLGAMLAGMIVVTTRQISGYYQHNSITVDFGNTVWDGAWVKIPEWLAEGWVETSPAGELEEWTLVYAFFNGVYEQDGFLDGRPVYKERRKFDRTPFDGLVPAEIRYCSDISAWVFTHESIFRTKSAKKEGCNWLLRSPETEEFDLLNVDGRWQVWVGVIGSAEVSIVTNECRDDSDCNLNGECIDGECNCYKEDGAQFLGTHCEVRLRDSCRTIIAEEYNETWSIIPLSSFLSDSYAAPEDALFQEYSRPVYQYVEGNPEFDSGLKEYEIFLESLYGVQLEDIGLNVGMILMYTGSRWVGLSYVGTNDTELFLDSVEAYHAFWNRAFRDVATFALSDPTKGDTPVGVDFYWVGERGEQFGPLGALYPAQKYNQTGRGLFRCSRNIDSSVKIQGTNSTTASHAGYCNWGPLGTGASSICDGDVQGGDWCNIDSANCESGCGGRWCTNDGPPSNRRLKIPGKIPLF